MKAKKSSNILGVSRWIARIGMFNPSPVVRYVVLVILTVLVACTTAEYVCHRHNSANATSSEDKPEIPATNLDGESSGASTSHSTISTTIPEWDPTRYLVLSLPGDIAMWDSELLGFLTELASASIEYVDIIILIDERDPYALETTLISLKEASLDEHLKEDCPSRIRIVPARLNSLWIRDYGPIFLRGTQNEFLLADSVYDDVRYQDDVSETLDDYLRIPVRSLFDLSSPTSRDTNRKEDDVVSMYVANYLAQQHGTDTKIVRVPLQLWGGDLYFDGLENAFTSSETLFMNGGIRDEFERLLAQYYNVQDVIYLEPLPGNIIRHIDMFLKVVDEKTFLVAEYPEDVSDDDIYMQYLHDEIRRVLEQNYRILAERFPDRRIVRVPTPPLERISLLPALATEIADSVFAALDCEIPDDVYDAADDWSLDDSLWLIEILSSYRSSPERQAFDELRRILRLREESVFSEEAALAIALARGLLARNSELRTWIAREYSEYAGTGEQVADLEYLTEFLRRKYLVDGSYEGPNSYSYVFRTYLNSTYVNSARGRLLLVPSYLDCAEHEDAVRDIYRRVYPHTQVAFVNADAIVLDGGAIHCCTLTIPEWKNPSDPVSMSAFRHPTPEANDQDRKGGNDE